MNPRVLCRYMLMLGVAALVWPMASSAVTRLQPNRQDAAPQQTIPGSNQKSGSILIYNYYTSNLSRTDTETEISVTNTHQTQSIGVRFFLVGQANCTVKQHYFLLSGSETRSFRASDIDPNASGYIVAVAVDPSTGAPIGFNFLEGQENVKTSTGHGGRVSAMAIGANFTGALPGIGGSADTATLNFDGSSTGYGRIPNAASLENLTSAANGNDTILVVNRIGGSLAGKVSAVGTINGAVQNRTGQKYTFTAKGGSCQFDSPLASLLPSLKTAIPFNQTATMELTGEGSISALELNANSRNGAFSDARNFKSSTSTDAATSLVIPVSAPAITASTGANLEMAMTANPALSVVRGSNITYTLTSTNRGPDGAFNVVIRDSVPVNTTFVSATPSAGGNCVTPSVGGPGTVVCTFSGNSGLLVARSVQLVVRVSDSLESGAEIVNTGETYSSTTDPNPSNNSRTIRSTVTATASELVITTNSLVAGKIGQPYSFTFESVNGVAPLAWSLVGGGLPNGLTFLSTGSISGTPTQTGIYPLRIRLTDANSRIAEKSMVLRIVSQFSASLADFDGDGRTDYSTWRPSSGLWSIVRSTNGSVQTTAWGAGYAPFNDIEAAGDFDGDGKSDLAVWRSSEGNWYILNSSDDTVRGELLGQAGDTPVPADYDGDGKADLAVWRGATGAWIIKQSSTGTVTQTAWGTSASPYFDVPVPADYDADGKTDLAVWRGSEGAWYILRSSDSGIGSALWGSNQDPYFDLPVPRDYDGDGKADFAIWRRGTGDWFILRSSNGGVVGVNWGASQSPYFDQPVPGDYDGDGLADIGVWRSSIGAWYIIDSSTGAIRSGAIGQSGDVPIPR